MRNQRNRSAIELQEIITPRYLLESPRISRFPSLPVAIKLKNPLSLFSATATEPPLRESWRLLLATLLLFALAWSVVPRSFHISDPSWYSAEAAVMAGKDYFPPRQVLETRYQFSHRYGLILPTAALYKLFGINLHTLNGILLLAVLMIIVCVWMAMPDERTRRAGLLLCLLSLPLWKHSIFLYPDLVVTAFMAASSLCLFSRERVLRMETASRLIGLAMIGQLLLFYAFLTKLSAYWVLPLWVWALVMDWRGSDRRPLLLGFWMPVMLTGLILGIGYLVITHIVWGSPWARFEAIESAQHLWAGKIGKDRLTTGPIKPFINLVGHWGLLLVAGGGLLFAPSRLRPWIGYLICCLGFYWFGSASLSSYQPLPASDHFSRMMLPAVPAVLIFAAFLIGRFPSKIVGTLVIITISGVPLYQWMKTHQAEHPTPSQVMISIIKKEITKNPDVEYVLICSEHRSCNTQFPFYFGYDYSDGFRAAYAGHLKDRPIEGEPVIFAYLNQEWENFLQSAYRSKHYRAELTSLPHDRLSNEYGRALLKIKADKSQLLEALFPK